MKRSDYTTANRAAWNEVAPIHRQETFERLLESFRQAGYSHLDSIESALLKKIDLTGKDVAQLCCNNGRELLSIKNLGAGRCVGFDISEEFISQARELAKVGSIDCEFVRTDVYDIPKDFTDSFDLIYLSIGAMCWLPDLPRFFDILSALLRPGGWVFVYDVHPMAEMFEPEDESDPPHVSNSYFKPDAFKDTSGLDYFGGSRYESLPMYSFLHNLSKVFGCCLDRGFTIRNFCEYQHDISGCFKRYQEQNYGIPLCYTLTAKRDAPTVQGTP